jgi:hypothetical protein
VALAARATYLSEHVLPFLFFISWDLKSRIIPINIPPVEILYKVEAVFLVVPGPAALALATRATYLLAHVLPFRMIISWDLKSTLKPYLMLHSVKHAIY